MARIFIRRDQIQNNKIYFDELSEKHAFGSLRLKANDRFTATDGNGFEYEAVICGDGKTAEILNKTQELQNGKKIHLYLSIIKLPRFEIALEKTSELGVFQIIPVTTQRSLPYCISENKRKRWHTILEQSSRQSARLTVPLLSREMSFSQAIEHACSSDAVLFPKVQNGINWTQIAKHIESAAQISLFIGPEGGFSPEELQMAEEKKFHMPSFGKNILRSETAAIAFCALLQGCITP